MPEKLDQKKQATQKVTLVGAVVNTALAIAQLVGGFITGSQALVADGFHTLSDLASDFVVFFAAQHAHKEADANHPYGHGRIETVATVILGLMLTGAAVGILMGAWERFSTTELLSAPSVWALGFAALAILSKEVLFHYTMHTAKRVRSKLLEANAWHHRSDVVSSLVVLVGIAGSQLGVVWLDGAAAVIVATMILYMAGRMILDSTSELVDTGLEAERTQEMQRFMASLPGVVSVHMLRTRLMGGEVFADAHIQVKSHISVSEGHHIAEYAMQQLKERFPEVTDVTVHIDPEDDEVAKPCAHLPIREEIIATLTADPLSASLMETVSHTILHYIDGGIELEIYLPELPEATQLDNFQSACQHITCIDTVRFYQAVAPQ